MQRIWSRLVSGGVTLVALRSGSDVVRIAGEQADGQVAEGVLSADGWGLILSRSGSIDAVGVDRRIVKALAYDAKGELVWSGAPSGAPPGE